MTWFKIQVTKVNLINPGNHCTMYVIQQEKTSELADYNLFSYFKHESTESSEDLLQPRHLLYQTPAPKSWSNSPKGYIVWLHSSNDELYTTCSRL